MLKLDTSGGSKKLLTGDLLFFAMSLTFYMWNCEPVGIRENVGLWESVENIKKTFGGDGFENLTKGQPDKRMG